MSGEKPYCTKAKSGSGYDIAIVNKKRKEYTLYRSYLDCNIDLFDEYRPSFYLCRGEFDKMLQNLTKINDYDVYGYDPKKWERYYTVSQRNRDLVDQIEIDEKDKCYRIYFDSDILITDGYDRFGIPIESSYVSRLIFDILKEGVLEKGFCLKEGI